MSIPSRSGYRRVALVALGFGMLLTGFAWALVETASTTISAERAATLELARRLAPTDLVLVTEARYLRHVALADRHSAFQDHPFAFEHFPSGAAIGVPAHLRRRDALAPADATLVPSPGEAR